jgi:hypothetical protein
MAWISQSIFVRTENEHFSHIKSSSIIASFSVTPQAWKKTFDHVVGPFEDKVSESAAHTRKFVATASII